DRAHAGPARKGRLRNLLRSGQPARVDSHPVAWTRRPGSPRLRRGAWRCHIMSPDTALSAEDLEHIAAGSHPALADCLGAHACADGSGVRFAVWAPNARDISVVGDFNDWRPGAHPMRLHQSGGVWEVFVPDVAEGALYKFAIVGVDGG